MLKKLLLLLVMTTLVACGGGGASLAGGGGDISSEGGATLGGDTTSGGDSFGGLSHCVNINRPTSNLKFTLKGIEYIANQAIAENSITFEVIAFGDTSSTIKIFQVPMVVFFSEVAFENFIIDILNHSLINCNTIVLNYYNYFS